LTKSQDGNYLKFGEAFYFFINPSLGPKNVFNQIHTLFHPILESSSIFLIEMKKFQQKKITLIQQKVDIYFEMVQSNTMVPKQKRGG